MRAGVIVGAMVVLSVGKGEVGECESECEGGCECECECECEYECEWEWEWECESRVG